MNNNSLTIAAISVLAALLATGAAISSETAFAGGHHYSKSVRQTAALDNNCGNGTMPLDINCQNLASQVKGNHNAVNVISFQPSTSSRADQGNDHKYDSGNHDDQGNNQGGDQGGNHADGGQVNGGQSRSQGGSHVSGSLAVGNPVGNPGIGAGA